MALARVKNWVPFETLTASDLNAEFNNLLTQVNTAPTSYTIGDLLHANSGTTLASLSAVATGNALISGGVGALSSWGKIGLTTHVIGTLPLANGGTNASTAWTTGGVFFGGASAFAQDAPNLFYDDTLNRLGIGINASLLAKLHVVTGASEDALALDVLTANNNFFSFRRSGVEVAFFDTARFGMLLGAEANPSYSFKGDGNTGMWSSGAGTIDWSTNAIKRLTLSTTALTSTLPLILSGGITHGSATLLTTTTALTNGAGAGAGTITNAPAAGNPTKWVPINDNGTTRYIPAW